LEREEERALLDYNIGQAGGGSTVMLRNGAEEALFGAKPQTKVLKGGMVGGKEEEEEDRRGRP
jgi:hypothetical protein